jgi:predicted lipoprotein with Yx(FWY)xxD motif
VTRDDGSKMWAYKGKPLYTFARDAAGAAATGVSANWPLATK